MAQRLASQRTLRDAQGLKEIDCGFSAHFLSSIFLEKSEEDPPRVRRPPELSAGLAHSFIIKDLRDFLQRNAYLEIGLELRAIRDGRLYKVKRDEAVAGRYSFETFEDYVASRWDIEYRRANQLIESATVAHMLESGKNSSHFLPSRESHVRPLLRLENDSERSAVWRSVVEKHGHDVIAAIRAKVETERRAAIAAATKERPQERDAEITQQIVESRRSERESAHKAAELFNTNRTYINEAASSASSRQRSPSLRRRSPVPALRPW